MGLLLLLTDGMAKFHHRTPFKKKTITLDTTCLFACHGLVH
jgi:hypothetical protein